MVKLSFLLGATAALASAGCLAPPPGAAEQPSAASPTSPAASQSPGNPGDLSKPLLVWNGDTVSPTAKQWASCDTQPCTATLDPMPKVGTDGSAGLEFKAECKSGYVGFGWNWTSWYAGGANDITGRKTLKFAIQIVSASPETAPDPNGIRVRLGCAKYKACGKLIGSLGKYEPKVTDGQWHQIAIPLVDMKSEDKDQWDDASVWEFQVHNWAPTPRDFTMHIDDISFE